MTYWDAICRMRRCWEDGADRLTKSAAQARYAEIKLKIGIWYN